MNPGRISRFGVPAAAWAYVGLALCGVLVLLVCHPLFQKQTSGDVVLSATLLLVEAICAYVIHRLLLRHRIRQHLDALTGLPSHEQFKGQIECLSRSTTETSDAKAAVLLLDIDRFKHTVRQQGYDFADRLLKQVAERLSQTLSDCEDIRLNLFLCRLEADRFAILMPDVSNCTQAIRLANRILSAMQAPLYLNEHQYHISFSIGISLFPDDGHDATAVLRSADIAMQKAKQQGGNRYELHVPESPLPSLATPVLEGYLRHALRHDELRLYYQPKLNLHSGDIDGTETLLRWQHPDNGLIQPDAFMTLAEETGLIIPITEWILKTACEQGHRWRSQSGCDLSIAVNLSTRQLYQASLPKLIADTLAETGFPAQALELEITESIAVQNLEETAVLLTQLKKLGVRLALDDFGSGFSSFSYLRHFPIDIIKIDRSFISNLSTSAYDIAATRAIITLAHSLGLQVVAEGVETRQQLDCLRQENCDFIQGHWVGEPRPAQAFERLLGLG